MPLDLHFPIKIYKEYIHSIDVEDLKKMCFDVELEDQAVVQSVQQGIKSRYYSRGRYSTTFETGVHHFHKILALITKI